MLGKGKCYFSGTTEDIENISLKFCNKMLVLYQEHMRKNAMQQFKVHEWVEWTTECMGGKRRFCSPVEYRAEHRCENHGVIHIYDKDNFLVHNSAVMSHLYNTAETATAFGFYFLNWDHETPNVLFSWADQEIAWQARRFGMAMLMPKGEVFEFIKKVGYDPKQIHLGNYESIAEHCTTSVAGHFQVTSRPVKNRLLYLFEDYAKEKEAGLDNFEKLYMHT